MTTHNTHTPTDARLDEEAVLRRLTELEQENREGWGESDWNEYVALRAQRPADFEGEVVSYSCYDETDDRYWITDAEGADYEVVAPCGLRPGDGMRVWSFGRDEYGIELAERIERFETNTNRLDRIARVLDWATIPLALICTLIFCFAPAEPPFDLAGRWDLFALVLAGYMLVLSVVFDRAVAVADRLASRRGN